MGYTHYWYVHDLNAVKAALPLVAADLKSLLPQLPRLAGPDGQGEPVLEAGKVAFNGPRPEDYETFAIDLEAEAYLETEKGLFSCCKTEYRPYDLAVQVALLLFRFHAEAIAPEAVRLNSDGNLLDWKQACRLVERSLGYPVDPFWALDREVQQVVAQSGEVFYVEHSRHDKRPLDEWLVQLHRHRLIPFAPPYSFRGPIQGFPPARPLEKGSSIYLGSRR